MEIPSLFFCVKFLLLIIFSCIPFLSWYNIPVTPGGGMVDTKDLKSFSAKSTSSSLVWGIGERLDSKSNPCHVMKPYHCKFCSNRHSLTSHEDGQNITSSFSLGW